MSSFFRLSILSMAVAVFVGCASSQMKVRKEQREKVAQTSKLYCEFINGDVYPDIDVAMNLEMAKRCDSNKMATITSYRSPSEAVGIVYCCTIKEKEDVKKSTNDSKLPDLKTPDSSKPTDFSNKTSDLNNKPSENRDPLKGEKK